MSAVVNEIQAAPHDPRLRVFDLGTPWFCLVVFHRRAYGMPRLQASFYTGKSALRWWLSVWKREP